MHAKNARRIQAPRAACIRRCLPASCHARARSILCNPNHRAELTASSLSQIIGVRFTTVLGDALYTFGLDFLWTTRQAPRKNRIRRSISDSRYSVIREWSHVAFILTGSGRRCPINPACAWKSDMSRRHVGETRSLVSESLASSANLSSARTMARTE
ncbi:hypothetical protein DAEQUDRAFT_352697 [Daedalea quercina L-15889]|uniref:Uncharacterized protein n=1 Tax=Daedalea quercina L-15889 TaxID=1314783 RepID=A0A165TPI4_9APHY|nr:hypothetical protein DAEQUDRAFT_352697 [Daedalea quercina L-15889]